MVLRTGECTRQLDQRVPARLDITDADVLLRAVQACAARSEEDGGDACSTEDRGVGPERHADERVIGGDLVRLAAERQRGVAFELFVLAVEAMQNGARLFERRRDGFTR